VADAIDLLTQIQRSDPNYADVGAMLAKALPLPLQPFLEWRLLHPDALEEIALVQRGGRLQGGHRAFRDQPFEPDNIDVEASPLERHVPLVGDQDRVGPEHAAQRHERLAQALTRVLVTRAWPQQSRELVARVAAPGRHRQVGEQRLSLVVREGYRGTGAETGAKTSEEDEGESGCQTRVLHGASLEHCRWPWQLTSLDAFFTFPRMSP